MKKAKVAITLDSDILAQIDQLVRDKQKAELEKGMLTSNRSTVIEETIKRYLQSIREVA